MTSITAKGSTTAASISGGGGGGGGAVAKGVPLVVGGGGGGGWGAAKNDLIPGWEGSLAAPAFPFPFPLLDALLLPPPRALGGILDLGQAHLFSQEVGPERNKYDAEENTVGRQDLITFGARVPETQETSTRIFESSCKGLRGVFMEG